MFSFYLPHAQIVAPNSHIHPCTHPPTLSSPTGTRIAHTRILFMTRIHIHTLLVPMPVFSPQSRDELKRAVDDCQSGSAWAQRVVNIWLWGLSLGDTHAYIRECLVKRMTSPVAALNISQRKTSQTLFRRHRTCTHIISRRKVNEQVVWMSTPNSHTEWEYNCCSHKWRVTMFGI